MVSLRASAAAIGLAAAIGGVGVATASPASAAVRDGYCQSGEFCYFYNSISGGYFHGSGSDFRSSLSNYGSSQPHCYEFRSPGPGRYQCIKNNAAAYWNKSSHSVRIYENTGYKGRYITVKPGGWGNLPTWLKNNEASHKFL